MEASKFKNMHLRSYTITENWWHNKDFILHIFKNRYLQVYHQNRTIYISLSQKISVYKKQRQTISSLTCGRYCCSYNWPRGYQMERWFHQCCSIRKWNLSLDITKKEPRILSKRTPSFVSRIYLNMRNKQVLHIYQAIEFDVLGEFCVFSRQLVQQWEIFNVQQIIQRVHIRVVNEVLPIPKL